MSAPDTSIRLDTGAFGAARRRRAWRTLAYWALLVAGAALLAATIAAVALLLGPGSVPATLQQTTLAERSAAPAEAAPAKQPAAKNAAAAPAPPPKATPVAVWNGFGGQGAATTLADRARGAGYPVVDVRDAPRRGYRSTYVLYVPGQEPAARALAKRLGLKDAAVRALDMPAAAIRPARLLVILAAS